MDNINLIENMEQYNNYIKNNKVVIDFYADWCKPCKEIYPSFVELAQNTKSHKFFKINIDNESLFDIINEYDVSKVPTFFVIENNIIIKRIDGPKINELKSSLEKLDFNILEDF